MSKRTKTINIISALLLPAFWLGASAQTIVTDDLGTSVNTVSSLPQLLQGQVSGVRISSTDGNPSGALIMNIRGLNSLRGDSQPLWIVDGTELNSTLQMNNNAFWQQEFGAYGFTSALNDLDFLSPAQIESIEVIKNTSATALYGAKGANGVVIVKTKTSAAEGHTIRFNSNFGINAPSSGVGKASISHNHSLVLTQGRNRTGYSLSAFFRGNQGILSGVDGNTAGLKANFETRANSVVQFGLNTIAAVGKMNSTLGTAKFGKSSRTLAERYRNLFVPDAVDGADMWSDSYSDSADSYRSITSVFLDLNLLPGLALKFRGGMDYEGQDRYIWYDNGTSFGNAYNGAAAILSTSLLNYNASATLSYERYFNKTHFVSVKLAAETGGANYKYSTMNATDFFTHVLGAKGLAFGASKNIPRKLFSRVSQFGYMAQLTYNFKSILNIEAGFRQDTTPKYDEGTYSLYPRGEVTLDLHRAFFPDFKAISGLSIEAGYGKSGRERYIPSENFTDFTGAPAPDIDYDVAVYYDALNRLNTSELQAGINLAFANDRVKFAARYYDRKTDDILNLYDNSAIKKNVIPKPILMFGDRKLMKKNVATVGNRGYEFDVKGLVFKTSDWRLDLYADAAINANRVLAVDSEELYCPSVGSAAITGVCAVGQSVGAFYGYRMGDGGVFKDLTGDGKVTPADREVLGNPIPKCSGSFGGTLSTKGLSLDFRFDAAMGSDILDMNSMFRDGATEVSDKYVEKGDYLRLANIGLSYQVPLKSKAIKGLKISAGANNLLTITDYSGFNPDVDSFGISNLNRGIDYGSYPSFRTVVLGLQLNF